MREKSRTFSTSDESRRHSWTMKRKYSCCFGGSETFPRSKVSAISRTEASGERSSCETLETKLVFNSLRSCWRWKTRHALTKPTSAAAAATEISAANQNVLTRWRAYKVVGLVRYTFTLSSSAPDSASAAEARSSASDASASEYVLSQPPPFPP